MKCCGTCKWWNQDWDVAKPIGDCAFPLPFYVQKLRPYEHSGEECQTYDPKSRWEVQHETE